MLLGRIRSFLLLAWFATDALALAPAMIRWAGTPANTFVLAPKVVLDRAAPLLAKHSDTVSLRQPLTIQDQQLIGKTSANKIPYFTWQPDTTITCGSSLCIEADGDRRGAAISINQCTGGQTQLWNVLSQGPARTKRVQLKGSNVCIAVSNNVGGLHGAPVELQECDEIATESWMFEEVLPLPTEGPTHHQAPGFSMVHAMISFFGVAVVATIGSFLRWSSRKKSSGAGILRQGGMHVDDVGIGLIATLAAREGCTPLPPNTYQGVVPAMMLTSVLPGDPDDVTKDKVWNTVPQSLGFAELSSEPYRQAHIFEGLNDSGKAKIAQQLQVLHAKLPGGGLEGYLSRARALLANSRDDKNPFAGLVPSVPRGECLTGEAGPGSMKYAELEEIGSAQLHKCAFCLVAGGLGERLGYPGIKISITAEVTSGSSFMQTYVDSILAFQAHARKATGSADLQLPLAIMTSPDTHALTLELLETNSYYGLSKNQVTLMRQEGVPALLDVEARIDVKDGVVQTKPHGHGDVHALLLQHGLTQRWISEGREWLVVFQDTNPLAFRNLCAVLGVSARNGFIMNSVTVPRVPREPVGGIATLQDPSKGSSITINVEYNQLDPLLKETALGGDVADATGFSPYPGNVNTLVFRIPEYDHRLQASGGIVPEFVNPKWADAARSKFKSPARLECMMQDFPRLCGAGDRIGFTQLDRLMCKTVLKNNLADARQKELPDCALSAEADIYACNAQLVRAAGDDVEIEAPDTVTFLGISAKIGARIVLKPGFAISFNEMKDKIKGKIRISKKSSLILGENASIDGLVLDGALELNSAVKDLVITNHGCALREIPETELSQHTPSFQIRGYTCAQDPIAKM